ncbi:MAG TPA: hypothetical protein VGB18_08400 [Candidatus Thermoplasmatota archaeon]
MHGERGRRAPFRRDHRGVSPVVGTILILVIMIISIGGIMAWGVPAIAGLQERAEYQAVLTQFLQMQSDVRGLRDPQNTRITQISVNDGKIDFDLGSRWVVSGFYAGNPLVPPNLAIDYYAGMYLTGWEVDQPNTLSIAGAVITNAHKITVDKFTGGSIDPVWSCPAPTCTSTVSLDGDDADLVGDVDFGDIDTVIRVQVHETGGAKFEAWIMNAGHLEYHLTERNENNRIHFEMGAVFSQHTSFFYLEQGPTVKNPDYNLLPEEDISLFIRVLQLTGTVPQGVGGRGSFPIIYHLVDNYGAARGRPSFNPAEGARIQIHGELEVPFCNYFEDQFDTATGTGWRYEVGGVVGSCPTDHSLWDSTSNVNLRYEKDTKDLIFDLSHSVVTTNIRTR